VEFIPYQEKEDLIYSLNAGDVHWCVSARGIKGVSCPSKAYGIMAAGKPILGVLEEGTEIRTIIEECGCGKCCAPEEYDEVEKNIRWYIDHSGTEQVRLMGENDILGLGQDDSWNEDHIDLVLFFIAVLKNAGSFYSSPIISPRSCRYANPKA
jgi:hypothetical protein